MSSRGSGAREDDPAGYGEGSPPTSSAPLAHFKSQEDQEIIRLALQKSPFFTCLDKEQIDRFVRIAHKEKFPPGAIVILEGCIDEEHVETEAVHQDRSSPLPDTKTTLSSGSISFPHSPSSDTSSRKTPTSESVSSAQILESYVEEPLRYESSDSIRPSPSIPTEETRIQPPVAVTAHANNPPSVNTPVSNASSTNTGHKDQVVPEQAEYRDEEAIVEPDDPSAMADSPLSPTAQGSLQFVPPPRSGKVRSLYIIAKGKADVWYEQRSTNRANSYIQPHSMGPGTLFGEGGFLFGRQHSASIVATSENETDLECWVVDLPTFRDYVLLSDNMKTIFRQFANTTNNDEETAYMTLDDFMKACEQQQVEGLPMLSSSFPDSTTTSPADSWARARFAGTLRLLRPGRSQSYQQISLEDFCWFYFLLARPDSEVDIAFMLMDQQQTGRVGLAQVAALVEPVFPDTNYESDFFRRYFGENGQRSLRLAHFSQFFADLHQELGRQAFLKASASTDGYLEPDRFVGVLRSALGWRLPQTVVNRLEVLYCQDTVHTSAPTDSITIANIPRGKGSSAAASVLDEPGSLSATPRMEHLERGYGDRIFAYPDFLAFQEVITNLPGICSLIERAEGIKKGPLSPDDFKVANSVLGMGGRLTRRQVELVFALFDLDKDGFISHQDALSVCGLNFGRNLVAVEGRDGKLTFAPPPEPRLRSTSKTELPITRNSASNKLWSMLEYFGLTALSATLGTVIMYPIDVCKTRIMNQRPQFRGTRMYRGLIDCMHRSWAKEGFFGLYRGLTPQLLGLAPEKMIKLQVNHLLRKTFGSRDEETGKPGVSLPLEVMAGAISGACQLLITNPMELTKIRMQMQGETSRILAERGWANVQMLSFTDVVKGLGFPGIYRGASSCLLRDMFFGALYFPSYTWLKEELASRNEIPGYATSTDLLAAGTIASIPAAFLTSPFDVVKTKLQTLPRPDEKVYIGIRDCTISIYRSEGVSGFFVGSAARVLRIAPQFGIALLAYENLSRTLGGHDQEWLPAPPTNAFVEPYDYFTAFSSR